MAVRVELLEKVIIAKRCFSDKCLEHAGKAWTDIYDIIEKLEKETKTSDEKEAVMHEYHSTMQLFTDDEVYGITDYLKTKEGV